MNRLLGKTCFLSGKNEKIKKKKNDKKSKLLSAAVVIGALTTQIAIICNINT